MSHMSAMLANAKPGPHGSAAKRAVFGVGGEPQPRAPRAPRARRAQATRSPLLPTQEDLLLAVQEEVRM